MGYFKLGQVLKTGYFAFVPGHTPLRDVFYNTNYKNVNDDGDLIFKNKSRQLNFYIFVTSEIVLYRYTIKMF